jgi:hypothetical protein
MLADLELRLRLMDQFPGYQQVLTAGPGIENFCDPKISPELARIANDGMAEWGGRFPPTVHPAPEDEALMDRRWSEYGWD